MIVHDLVNSVNDENIANYSQDHSGICLEFKVSPENPYFGQAAKIIYQKEYPAIDYRINFEQELNQFDRVVLTKSILWVYEEEYRLIKVPKFSDKISTQENVYDFATGPETFPEDLLTGVILGCKKSKEKKEIVKQWLTSRRKKPNLYEARMQKNKFGLDIIRID